MGKRNVVATAVANGAPVAGPRSMCACGHTGDGPHSEHHATDFGIAGHGACSQCNCAKFSWAGWIKAPQVTCHA